MTDVVEEFPDADIEFAMEEIEADEAGVIEMDEIYIPLDAEDAVDEAEEV